MYTTTRSGVKCGAITAVITTAVNILVLLLCALSCSKTRQPGNDGSMSLDNTNLDTHDKIGRKERQP